MNKNLKVILPIVLAVAVLLVAAFVPGSSKYKKINFEEYNNLEGSKVVYIGTKQEVKELFKDIKTNDEYSLVYLDYSKLTKKEKKKVTKGAIEIWENYKKIANYNFDEFKLKDGDKQSELKTVGIDEYLKLKDEQGLHFMFIGRETCGYCAKFKEAIDELYNDYKIDIYYIDTDTLDEEGLNSLVTSDEYLTNEEWGTPTSMIYYNGNKLETVVGYKDKDGIVEVLNSIGLKKFLIDNKVI